MRTLSRYQEPSSARSIVELAITATPLGLVWILMWTALDSGLLWLYAGFILPGAGFLVRLFIIQHDCGHGSFFRRRLLNDWGWPRDQCAHPDTLRSLASHTRDCITLAPATFRAVAPATSIRSPFTSMRPCLHGDGLGIGSTVTPSACSALALPGCSFSRIGFLSASCAESGGRGSARCRPTSRS